MNFSAHIAEHFRQVYFGGNWTSVNLTNTLNGVNWEQATAKKDGFNTIAALVYHINYYVAVVSKVLQGGALDAHDKFSFDVPAINSPEDWQRLLDKSRSDAESFAILVEQLPESRLEEDFTDPKYGSYYRNLHGIIEHCHYHLGQIVILKKLV